jgi:hypothetical protein
MKEIAMSDVENLPTYALTLIGEGMSITRDVDQPTARAIVDIVLGGRPSISPRAEQGGPQVSQSDGKRMSLREFLNEADAKRMPDKIVTIGEYLISQTGQEDFSGDDVRDRFRAAGEVTPANFSRDFKWTISNGWVAEDPKNAGRYYVTQTGKAAIQAKFSGDVRKNSGFKPVSRRRRKAGARASQ